MPEQVVDEKSLSPDTLERLACFSLQDLFNVRLLLRGGSVIDWHRLAFENLEQVDRFLRVSGMDPRNARDLERMEQIRTEAVAFLVRNFSFRIPESVGYETPVRELFLLASTHGRHHTYACVILKLMHVLHHLRGRDLLFKLPISEHELFDLVEEQVVRVVEEIRAAGHPVIEFAWSRKEQDAQILKLLARHDTIAAKLYDKLRFRLVMRHQADIVGILRELHQRIIPFNYVIPGESVNEIVNFRELVERTPLASFAPHLQRSVDLEDIERTKAGRNEFSGPGYRSVSFVADLPLRLDPFVAITKDLEAKHGNIVFVLTEFQLLDEHTAIENESGENSHEAYKQRKVTSVRTRLTRGKEPES